MKISRNVLFEDFKKSKEKQSTKADCKNEFLLKWSQVFSHHNVIQKIRGSYDRDNNKIVMHEGIEGNYSMRRTIHTRKSYIMER